MQSNVLGRWPQLGGAVPGRDPHRGPPRADHAGIVPSRVAPGDGRGCERRCHQAPPTRTSWCSTSADLSMTMPSVASSMPGGLRVAARNPHRDRWGVTIMHPDGPRLVLSHRHGLGRFAGVVDTHLHELAPDCSGACRSCLLQVGVRDPADSEAWAEVESETWGRRSRRRAAGGATARGACSSGPRGEGTAAIVAEAQRGIAGGLARGDLFRPKAGQVWTGPSPTGPGWPSSTGSPPT